MAQVKQVKSNKVVKSMSAKAPGTIVPGSKQDVMPLRWRGEDTPTGVTRVTAQRMAKHLGVTETAMVHLAMRALANSLWPVTDIDDDEPSEAELTAHTRADLGELKLPLFPRKVPERA